MTDEPRGGSCAARARRFDARRALLARDARLSARLRRAGDRSPRLRAVAIPFARSADGWPWVLAILAVAAAGDPLVRRRALGVAAAVLATGLVVKLGKTLTRRARPAGEWGASYRRSDPHAFPSGHSARAFLVAVLASGLGSAWLGAALALWATLVAASRVLLGVHHLSDVVAGACLGIGCGLVALAL
ncbi:MAG: phosphatase PAP2 family protein [Deltaproteobacteria bacterium]|nr:phosphatase PAP2 family protein [Deltaproteobacteria bacterium]